MSDSTDKLRIDRLEHDMGNVKHQLYGVDGNMGMTQMVAILWRTHVVWPLCTASAIGGAVLTLAVSWAIKHF